MCLILMQQYAFDQLVTKILICSETISALRRVKDWDDWPDISFTHAISTGMLQYCQLYNEAKSSAYTLLATEVFDIFPCWKLISEQYIPKGTCIGVLTGELWTATAFKDSDNENSYGIPLTEFFSISFIII